MRKHIAAILPYVVVLALVLAPGASLLTLSGCPSGGGVGQASVPSHLIECAKEATRARSFDALESVTAVLVSAGGQNWMTTAKNQLFDIAARWGHDAVACALGLKRGQFAAAAVKNPDDDVSTNASVRADMLMEDIGYQVKLD